MPGTLYLIPNVIAEQQWATLSPQVLQVLPTLKYFLAEDIRNARRFLSALKIMGTIENLHFNTLDKNTAKKDLQELLQPIFQNNDMGILSDSGCPGVADPGALAVAFAHQHQIKVKPLVGPSSILLALMGSGLNGQSFAFLGYLPIEKDKKAKAIKEIEKDSARKNQTQIFIETPYRNQSTFEDLIKHLHPETYLTLAFAITSEKELIQTKKVLEWRKSMIQLEKEPCVFLLLQSI